MQPLTRMVARIHVLEEARHMTLRPRGGAAPVPGMGEAQLAVHRTMTAQTA